MKLYSDVVKVVLVVEVLVVKDLLKSVMMVVYSTLTPSLSTSGAAAHIKFTTTCVPLCEVLGRGGGSCKSRQMMILLHTTMLCHLTCHLQVLAFSCSQAIRSLEVV